MRVGQAASEFLRWRWAPFVGLVGASLFYVLLVIILIPSRVGAAESDKDGDDATQIHDDADSTGTEPAEPPTAEETPARTRTIGNPARPALTSPPTLVPKRRGFSPPLERPEPAPQELPPQPPPPVAQPPVPTPPPAPAAPPPPPTPPPDPALAGAAAAAQAATRAGTRASRLAARRGLLGRPVQATNDEDAADEDEDEDEPAAQADPEADAEEGSEDDQADSDGDEDE